MELCSGAGVGDSTIDGNINSTSRCIFFQETEGFSPSQSATMDSLDSDGFTLSWTKSGSGGSDSANIAWIAKRIPQ